MGCGATKAAVNVCEPRQLAASAETRATPAAITATEQVQDGHVVCTASAHRATLWIRAHTTCRVLWQHTGGVAL